MSSQEHPDPFDPQRLGLGDRPRSQGRQTTNRRPIPRHQSGALFLKGPIPLDWLTRAARLPGKALPVALALWFRAGVDRQAGVGLSTVLCQSFGVDRYAKRRALFALEQAGLIQVERQRGKNPRVTLLSIQDTTE